MPSWVVLNPARGLPGVSDALAPRRWISVLWHAVVLMLIAAEAGGEVTDFKGKAFAVDDPEILATNGRIHLEMMSLLELKEKI